jgi:signal transduction histidine kinase
LRQSSQHIHPIAGLPFSCLRAEAFFTTKRAVGTGLGLWISADIVAKHGGSIHVRSKLETGTAFTIALPYEHIHAA